jgi:hypothetical protein
MKELFLVRKFLAKSQPKKLSIVDQWTSVNPDLACCAILCCLQSHQSRVLDNRKAKVSLLLRSLLYIVQQLMHACPRQDFFDSLPNFVQCIDILCQF